MCEIRCPKKVVDIFAQKQKWGRIWYAGFLYNFYLSFHISRHLIILYYKELQKSYWYFNSNIFPFTERMHHLNGPGGNKNKKPAPRRQSRAKAKDSLNIKGPPNVSLEPIASPKVESPTFSFLIFKMYCYFFNGWFTSWKKLIFS